VRKAVSLDAGGVVRLVAVGEAVGHDEVEVLVAARLADGRRDERGIRRLVVGAAGAQQLEADALLGVVEDHAHVGVSRDGERDVVAAAVQAPARVPRVVRGDLVLVRPGRHGEVGSVDAGGVGRQQVRRLAGGLPVLGAPEFALQRADECERVALLGRRSDGYDGENGCRDGARDPQCQPAAHARSMRHP
jgi:hypothetical protein